VITSRLPGTGTMDRSMAVLCTVAHSLGKGEMNAICPKYAA
jgi:hypothetical protein